MANEILGVAELLDEFYRLAEPDEDRDEEAADLLFDQIDRMCHAGMFGEINDFLGFLDPDRLSSVLVMSAIVITRCVREKLAYRPTYIKRAERRLVELCGEDKMNKLLQNLR